MQVKTILNRVHKIKGFVYEKAAFGDEGIDVAIRDALLLPRPTSETAEIVKMADQLLDKIGMDKIENMLQEGIPARAFSISSAS